MIAAAITVRMGLMLAVYATALILWILHAAGKPTTKPVDLKWSVLLVIAAGLITYMPLD